MITSLDRIAEEEGYASRSAVIRHLCHEKVLKFNKKHRMKDAEERQEPQDAQHVYEVGW